MVDVWVTQRVGNVVTLNTGDVIDIDSYPGNGWTANRCANITESVQRNLIDHVVDRKALPADDPDKTMTEAELAATYGGWFVELNTQGNSNEYRLRTTIFRLFPVDADWNEVANGTSFNFMFTQVDR